ncbi:MAG: type II toxin-antitoxin system ParD family antitoxin [Pseudomonadota bacterium]
MSISEQQDAVARALVSAGRYASISAVVQLGLELLRQETEMKDAELAAQRALLEDREKGPFVPIAEGRKATEAMIDGILVGLLLN